MSDPDPIHCLAYEGLCNRMNCVASAMATGRKTILSWAVNQHCPAEFGEVFAPVAGLEISNERMEQYRRSADPGRLCWFYPRNVMGLAREEFRDRLMAAYRELVGAMTVETFASPAPGSLGLAYRGYLPEIDPLPDFLEKITRTCDALQPASVFVASDSPEFKERLVDSIGGLGIPTAANDCRLANSDLERSLEGVRGMCMDLKSLTRCELGVISNNTRSTVPDSLRAFGIRTYHTFDDGFHRYGGRDDLFESQPISAILPG